MSTHEDITALAAEMAACTNYDESWMIGLELQTLGTQAVQGFCFALEKGTPESRRAAAFWLSDEPELVPAEVLLKMAQDKDSEIRFHAAYCLGYIKDKRTVETLQKLAKAEAEDVRQTAVQSLYAAAKINECLDTILDDYQTILQIDNSPIVREEVVTHLANFLKSPVRQRAIAILEHALKDKNQMVREQAKISLSVLQNEVWEDAKVPLLF